MITKISQLTSLLAPQTGKKKLAIAVAQDENALESAVAAEAKGIIEPILVGDKSQIIAIAQEAGHDISRFEIVDEPDKNKAVEKAVRLVSEKKASILMKGNISTGALLRAVLNKEWGLRKEDLLSHLVLFELKNYHKLLGLTDAAMNIAPDLNAKVAIINNAVAVFNRIGIAKPKIAAIAAVETVSNNMPATLDAAILSKMAHRGQIKNCIVDGPLAFDNAISAESAHHKGIVSDVAGDADLLLFPQIESSNAVYKALSYFGDSQLAAVILGAAAPIVLTSRSDTYETKLNSILLAAIL